MSIGATPPLLKRLNERTVLDAIRGAAPISRAEISRRAGISKPTVSLALQSLLRAGLVREAAPDARRPRFGAVYFEPVEDAAVVFGFDIGARFVRGAICDLGGRIRARQDVETHGADAGEVVATTVRLRDALLATADVDPRAVDGAVVGVPGVVEADGRTVRLAANVPGLEGDDFVGRAAEALGFPITLENDINLAALGEQWRGVARGVSDFAFLSVGTGLGAGLVLGGRLHRGQHGAAGEVDYVAAGMDERIDPSGPALSEVAAAEAAASRSETLLLPPYDARTVFAAARAGDGVALDVVREEARRIARHIAPLAAVADVGLVVLGGGIGVNADLLLDDVRRLLGEWLPYPPRVDVSRLGDAAVLTGAVSVALHAALDNVFARHAARTA